MRITEEQKEEMKKLRSQGMTLTEVGKKFGVAGSCVFYHTNPEARKKYIKRIVERYKNKPEEIKALDYEKAKKYSSDYHKDRYRNDPEFRARKKQHAYNSYSKTKKNQGIEDDVDRSSEDVNASE